MVIPKWLLFDIFQTHLDSNNGRQPPVGHQFVFHVSSQTGSMTVSEKPMLLICGYIMIYFTSYRGYIRLYPNFWGLLGFIPGCRSACTLALNSWSFSWSPTKKTCGPWFLRVHHAVLAYNDPWHLWTGYMLYCDTCVSFIWLVYTLDDTYPYYTVHHNL